MATPPDQITQLIEAARRSSLTAEGAAADTPALTDDPVTNLVQQFRTTEASAAGTMTDTAVQRTPELDLGDEFSRGLGRGVDSLQMSLYGIAQMVGREFTSDSLEEYGFRGFANLEDFGFRGVQRNINEITESPVSVEGFTDIEDFDDFVKWTASAFGNAIPSLSLAFTGGGIGASIGGAAAKKAVEQGIASTLRNRMVRNMTKKGISEARAQAAVTKALSSRPGMRMITDAMTKGPSQAVIRQGFARGARVGAFTASASPQIGEAEVSLTQAGVGSGLTSLAAGVAGGILEVLPVARVLDRVFPGVDKAVSKNFVADFAKFAGIQGVLEGSTEGAQEVVQLAALAFHDPTFDLMDPANGDQIIDAFAAGALVGVVTGGVGESVGTALSAQQRRKENRQARRNRPTLPPADLGPITEGPEGFPEGFEPADNTLFEEIRGRVDNVVRSTLTPALNTIRDSFQSGADTVNETIPKMNGFVRGMTGQVQAAHDEFVAGHQPVIDDAKRFAKEQVAWIYENAKAIPSTVKRQEWIAEQLQEVQQSVQDVANTLRERAQRMSESVRNNISNSAVLTEEQAQELRTGRQQTQPSDEFTGLFQEQTPVTVDPITSPEFVFGKPTKGNKFTRGEQAQPYETRAGARNQVNKLKKRYPSAPNSAFVITELGPKQFVVEIQGETDLLLDDEVVSDAIEASRKSARAHKNAARKVKIGKTIFDVPTLVFGARRLGEGDTLTLQEAFAEISGQMLDRGDIGDSDFIKLRETFDRLFPEEQKVITLKQAREQGVVQEFLAEQKQDAATTAFDPADTTQVVGGGITADTRSVTSPEPTGPTQPGDFQETDEARQAQIDEEARDVKRRGRPSKVQPRLSSKADVAFFMPGMNKAAVQSVKDIVTRVTKMLTGRIKLRVITREGAQRMIDQKHEHAQIAADALRATVDDSVSQAIYYDPSTDFAYIVVGNMKDDALADGVWALSHELGHLVHFDTWNHLSDANQQALYEAFLDDVKRGKVTGAALPSRQVEAKLGNPFARASSNMFEFREWMADQFSNWMVDRRQPRNALERFLEAVGKKLDDLWSFMSANRDRFGALNKTYADFADAVALDIRESNPDATNRFFLNEHAGTPLLDLWPSPNDSKALPGDPDFQRVSGSFTPGLTIRQSREMAERIGNYRAVVARAKPMVEWMKAAYKVYLAPSTSAMQDLNKKGITAANQLVRIFNRDIGKVKKSQNYHQRVDLMKGSFMNRFDRIMGEVPAGAKERMAVRLRKAEEGKLDPSELTLREKQIRKLFDDMHDYLVESGLPVGKIENYFPKIFSREKLIANEERIINHLISKQKFGDRAKKEAFARGFFNSLISREAEEAGAMRQMKLDPLSLQSPSLKNMRSRTAQDTFFNQFMEDNLDAVVGNYVNAAVKRGEYNRLLGMKAPEGLTGGDTIPKSVWNGRAKAEKILSDAKEQGATKEDLKLMKDYIDANLGMFGRDAVSEKARSVMATIVAYQNMRTLLFTVFASLPDLVGPAIRSGNMKQSFGTVIREMKKIVKNDSDLAEMARAWGQVSSMANQHVMAEYVDNHFMPPFARKMNNAFFKYTGLNWYTDFTRKMALAVGIDYIKNQADAAFDGTKDAAARRKAEQALGELGLKKEDVEVWRANGERTWGGYGYEDKGNAGKVDEKVAEGLIQFINESILRPNASQRPIMASHPGAMLVYHLKGFMYAIHDTVLKRLVHNFNKSDSNLQRAAAVAPALAMMMLTALGLELRELITRDNRTKRMDGWEYTWELAERSGLLGLSQLGWDFSSAGARGQSEFAGLAGPAMSQFGDLLSKPSSQTIPKGIPIVSQLPWARDALREATPL